MENESAQVSSDKPVRRLAGGLFDKYLNNKGIFKNREVLRHSHRPHTLPHRKDQIDSIASILAPDFRTDL